ncbi:hypothetical protein MKZ38_003637 [Zalerion maritima]|uniref:Uncharacterized protein n=1 Tax=Zalerion maritima TaxID=339359 RepID=A0AAD5WS88_9PEZI|nr:hypothetical protein MKZ38_003637 [Zalerion maritima]
MDLASMVTPIPDAVEFRLIKAETTEDGSLTAESKARVEALAQLFAALEGVKSLYYGQQIEDPSIVVFCAQSASDVPQLQLSCEEPGPWPTNNWLVPMNHNLEKVLAAPVMEMCTAFDCNKKYIGAVKTFVANIDNGGLAGYHAAAYGETTNPLTNEEGATPSKSANLILGWESMEAHKEAKAKPGNPIMANINLLREGRRSLAMGIEEAPFNSILKRITADVRWKSSSFISPSRKCESRHWSKGEKTSDD